MGARMGGRQRRGWVGLLVLFTLFYSQSLAPAALSAGSPAQTEPTVAAANAAVLSATDGVVLFDRAMHDHVAPASLTKLMTALVALERGDPAQSFTVTQDDLIGEASMGLQAGEAVTLEVLLYGLLLPSGNDAAMTIARSLGAQQDDATPADGVARFVGWMNASAAGLGLRDTHFVNPHGFDEEGHYSSAYDLARLAARAWQQPLLARIWGSRGYTSAEHGMKHGNQLVGRYPGVVGGKTGFTDNCGFCLITAAEREGRRLVVVVLHDTHERWLDDTVGLIEYGFTQLAMSPAPAPEPAAPEPAASAGEAGDESSPAPADAAAPPAGERPAARALPVTLLAALPLALLCGVVAAIGWKAGRPRILRARAYPRRGGDRPA